MAFGLGVSVSALLSVRRCFFTVWLYVCVIRDGRRHGEHLPMLVLLLAESWSP